MKKYIECLEKEIEKLIYEESKSMTPSGEKMLHVLFENHKHAKEYLVQKQ